MRQGPRHDGEPPARSSRDGEEPRDDGHRFPLIRHSEEAIAVVDAGGELLYANPAGERLFRIGDDAPRSRRLTELVHPDDVADVVATLADATSTGRSGAPVAFRVAGDGGAWRCLEASAHDHRADASVGGIVLNAHDVTDRLAAELRVRGIVEATHDGIMMVDTDGTVSFVNDRFCEMLGLGRDALEGATARPAPGTRDASRANAIVAEVVRSGDALEEYRYTRPDGSDAWLGPVTRRMKDPGGDDDGTLVTVVDETALHLAEQRLAQQEAWHQAVMRHAFDLVVVIDRAGIVQYGSAGVERLLGHPAGALRGWAVLDVVSPADRERALEALDRVVVDGSAEESLELRVLHRDGSYRWVEVRATNLLDDPAVAAVILHGRDVTDRRLAEAEMSYRSLHDPLTDLPNRLLLRRRLSVMLERCQLGEHVAVFFIDLDRFRLINDSRGHLIGDTLLQEVAARLSAVVKRGDTLVRFGGDAFVLAVEGVREEADALRLGERILSEAFGDPYEVDGELTHVSASIGVALGGDPRLLDRLLADADAAMSRAKEKGRARVEMFEESIRETVSSHLETEQALRSSIDRGELVVYYQPVISLERMAIVGSEALVRWNHPRRGLVEPDDFIPLAEETGLVVPIGAFVFAEACAQLTRIRGRWPEIDFVMSVNVSPLQLRSGSAAEFGKVVREAGAEARDVVLEVTESVLIAEDDAVVDALRMAQASGMRVAVDDFGTGYSSLSYMKRLPVDILKIDKSFVGGLGVDPQDVAVIEAVIAMARSLELEVIAEGVESRGQFEQLRLLGCRFAQGFFFGRPVPSASLEARLERGIGALGPKAGPDR